MTDADRKKLALILQSIQASPNPQMPSTADMQSQMPQIVPTDTAPPRVAAPRVYLPPISTRDDSQPLLTKDQLLERITRPQIITSTDGYTGQENPQNVGLPPIGSQVQHGPDAANTATAPSLPAIPPSHLQDLRRGLQVLDEEGWRTNNRDKPTIGPRGETVKGKDHYSTGDKIAHFLAGWATHGLAGGIGAVQDRHFFERPGRERQRNELLQQIGTQQQLDQFDTNIAHTQADTADRLTKPGDRDAELKRKLEKDAATIAYWNRKADHNDLKLAGDDELRTLRDKWMTSKDKNDIRRLDLVEKEMTNRTLRNTENNNTRKDIATSNINARKELVGITQAGAAARATQAQAAKNDTQARQTLVAIEASNAPAEQKAAAKAELFRLHPTLKP